MESPASLRWWSDQELPHHRERRSGGCRSNGLEETMTREPMMREDDSSIVVPLLTEELSVAKQQVVTGRVQISTVTREEAALVNEVLASEHVEIERVPVGKAVDHAPAVREEGDTLIIPVV